MTLVDRQGGAISLGPQLGVGGEGAVHALNGDASRAAKVFHQPIPPEKAEKLLLMAQSASKPLLDLAAWPLDTLHRQPGGPVVGLLMPRITGFKPIHELYGPKNRLQSFPDAQWPFLLHTATNVARAFSVMHAAGHVVGDVNHGNLLVGQDGTVKFIDCDSFQITPPNNTTNSGRPYLCEVGVSTHTPPELQGVNFRNVVRTPNHDMFGVAVVIFQLLMMARHPFSGAFTGRGEMPLELAIREYRYAYGPGAAARQMRAPPGSLPLAVLGPLAALFERAFTDQPRPRPSATEWRDALSRLAGAIVVCPDNPTHHFLKTVDPCPWCAVERQFGFSFFRLTAAHIAKLTRGADFATIWARLVTLSPLPAPVLSEAGRYRFKPSPAARALHRRLRRRLWLGWGLAVLALLPLAASRQAWPLVLAGGLAARAVAMTAQRGAEREALLTAYQTARAEYDRLRQSLDVVAAQESFSTLGAQRDTLKQRFDGLGAQRQEKLDRLRRDHRERQLLAFLDHYLLAEARIPGIGEGLKATLASYGIETAADVVQTRITGIAGFGPVRTQRLTQWRDALIAAFVYDPHQAIDAAALAQVELEIRKTERALLSEAVRLEGEMLVALKRSHVELDRLAEQIDLAAKRLAQARANATLILGAAPDAA